MELSGSLVADLPPLVDQDEAGPEPDAVEIPGGVIVVLGHRVADLVASQRLFDVGPVMLAGVGREFGGMDTDDGQSLVAVAPIEFDEGRNGVGAVVAGEDPEVEQHYAAP